jgi:2-hydroxy-3-oxopropionate reductase
MTRPKIGFIGLGIMGTPMSRNLLKAGYNLALYDINRATTKETARLFPDAIIADSPCEVAKVSDIVITMLPSGRPVQQVTLGETGLIHGFKPGSLLVDTSSSEPFINIAIEKAKELALELPLSYKGRDIWEMAAEFSGKGASISEMVKYMESITGTRIETENE